MKTSVKFLFVFALLFDDAFSQLQPNISGLTYWTSLFNQCVPNYQSTIHIDLNEGWGKGYLLTGNKPFIFVNYDFIPTSGGILNNGFLALAEPRYPSHAKPILRGGGLSGDYELHHFNFHHGQESDLGSSHVIDGVTPPLELHFVHFKREFGTIEEAVKNIGGLAIIVVVFRTSILDNEVLSPITDLLFHIREAWTSKFFFSPHSLLELLPVERNAYIRYEGSLAFPDCHNIVVWTIFGETVPISSNQLKQFAHLQERNPFSTTLKSSNTLRGFHAFTVNKPQKKFVVTCRIPILCPLLSHAIGV